MKYKKLRLFTCCLLLPVFGLAAVRTGLDVIEAGGFEPLKNKRIGLITNHTGVNSGGKSAAEVFANSKTTTFAAIFSPEHGFSGVAGHGELVANSTATAYGVPVHSLYGQSKRPDFKMLEGIDVLVFDIQDVGARFYTYLTTMAYCMEEAAKYGVPFFVLDRPNPISGLIVEGPVLTEGIKAFTAYLPVPVRHGMTAGEIALLYAARAKLPVKPEIIRMKGWKRKMWYDDTGLKWVALSPNMRNLEAAAMYPGIGCFEATNISVGRGTNIPFLWIGAPWFDAKAVIAGLNERKLKGVKFYGQDLTPDSDVYAGQLCHGVRFELADRGKARPFDLFIEIICLLRDLKTADFAIRWEEMEKMTGSRDIRRLYESGAGAGAIIAVFRAEAEAFKKSRKKYLLY